MAKGRKQRKFAREFAVVAEFSQRISIYEENECNSGGSTWAMYLRLEFNKFSAFCVIFNKEL